MLQRLGLVIVAALVAMPGCSYAAGESSEAAAQVVPDPVADPLAAWHTALAEANTGQANVMWLGSSSTYGVGASTQAKRYTDVVTAGLGGGPVVRVAESYPTRNDSPGVHGYVSAPGGANSEKYISDNNRPWILWERPSLIVHMVGSNDSVDWEPFAVPVDEYEANIGAQIDRLDASTTRPMSHLLVHTYRRFDVTAAKWKTYGDALRRVAATRDNVAVLDVSQVFESADHAGADPQDLIYDVDLLHPSDAGHALIADLITGAIVEEAPTPEPDPTPSQDPTIPTIPTAPPVSPPNDPGPGSGTAAPAAPVPTLARPAAPRGVKAVRAGRKTRLAWRSVAGAEEYVARCGRMSTTVETRRAVLRSSATACKVRAVNAGGASPWVKVTVRR